MLKNLLPDILCLCSVIHMNPIARLFMDRRGLRKSPDIRQQLSGCIYVGPFRSVNGNRKRT
jgi:hypothetical protein